MHFLHRSSHSYKTAAKSSLLGFELTPPQLLLEVAGGDVAASQVLLHLWEIE